MADDSWANIEMQSSEDAEEEDEPPRELDPGSNRRGCRGAITDIHRSLVKKEAYDDTLSKVQSNLIRNNSGCNSVKLKNVFDKHLEQFRIATGSEKEFDEDFLMDMACMGKSLRTLNAEVTLGELEEMEHRRNLERAPSKRVRKTVIKMNAWHQKHTLKEMLRVSKLNPGMAWLTSFYRCDPRWQIGRFFDEVAKEGGNVPMDETLKASPLPDLFCKASVFTVWRPTSDEAIKNMMLGVACGKGLDIKGKSAKQGNISSYVPFLQIYEGPHKQECKSYMKPNHKIRIFYQDEKCRDKARDVIHGAMGMITANNKLQCAEPEAQDIVNDTDFTKDPIELFALDIEEPLFWECYVMMQDCSRTDGTGWDIGRKSLPPFMSMNLDTIRRTPGKGEPRAVVYQMSKTNPMEPRMLLMAYEENGGVKPVVSDFDCFILGSRGVRYKNPIPPDQVELLQWSVRNIGEVLDARASASFRDQADWIDTWFQVLNKYEDYHPKPPRFGNGDPKSYEIIEVGVSRLHDTGCVRHGAECFNWYFPQEIDDEFLVISDTLPGNIKWKKMNVKELQEILIEKIDVGFTFPINPKWVLCDPGWKRVYDKLLASNHPNVQDSINCWLPPESGLREQIEEISARHPDGFKVKKNKMLQFKSSTLTVIRMNEREKKMLASGSSVNGED